LIEASRKKAGWKDKRGIASVSFGQEHIAAVMRRRKLDALLFWSLENIRYLCGFTGSDGALILAPEERIFLSDSRYEEQAKGEIRSAAFKKYKKKIEGVVERLKVLKVKRLGFEASALTYESYLRLREKLPRVTLVPLAEELTLLRARKEPGEIGEIRRAIQIASESFLDTLARLKPAVREKGVGDFLEIRMKRRGAESPAFPTIVASGPRGALPHGKPTDKAIRKGEVVVIDFGARFRGYHSDETKTVILGKPDGQQRKRYDLVRRAQERAMKAIRPGASVRRIDAAAREVISRAGYGELFGHGTGHGIGLAVHEPPSISPRGSGVVEAGMVFSIEPGMYLPGWGGIRLEDLVLVTDRGYEILTYLPKDLKDNILMR
jgi:Xaa-Pro aminopeptidase